MALSTGEESLLLIMPVYNLEYLPDLPKEPDPIQLEANGKTIRYVLSDGKINGHIIQDEKAFEFFGHFPTTNQSKYQADLENLLTSFTLEELGNVDMSKVWLLGTRSEGTLEMGETVNGYVPMASISEWTFSGKKGDVINLNIQTQEPGVKLILNVVDEQGNSALRSLLHKSSRKFTESIKVNKITLPDDGIYRIQVTATTGFGKFGPWDPPEETKIYG